MRHKVTVKPYYKHITFRAAEIKCFFIFMESLNRHFEPYLMIILFLDLVFVTLPSQ